MDPTNDQILKKYRELPENIKRALFSAVTADRIFSIGKNHGLAIDKIGILSREIGWVLLGEKRSHDFVKNLEKELDVSHDIAYQIAQEVNHTIFFEIRENLKLLHGVSQSNALIPDVREDAVPLSGAKPAPDPTKDAEMTKTKPSPERYWEAVRKNPAAEEAKSGVSPTEKPVAPAVTPPPQKPEPKSSLHEEVEKLLGTSVPQPASAVMPPDVKETAKPQLIEEPKANPSAPPRPEPKPAVPPPIKTYGVGDPYREPID